MKAALSGYRPANESSVFSGLITCYQEMFQKETMGKAIIDASSARSLLISVMSHNLAHFPENSSSQCLPVLPCRSSYDSGGQLHARLGWNALISTNYYTLLQLLLS